MIAFLRRLLRPSVPPPAPAPPPAPGEPPVRPGPWGRGWRVLVFRYMDGDEEELQVLAPVDGYAFDWDRLRQHVRGKPWPAFERPSGVKTGVVGWRGHHTYIEVEGEAPMRLPLASDMVPGDYHAGAASRCVSLVEVREAVLLDGAR